MDEPSEAVRWRGTRQRNEGFVREGRGWGWEMWGQGVRAWATGSKGVPDVIRRVPGAAWAGDWGSRAAKDHWTRLLQETLTLGWNNEGFQEGRNDTQCCKGSLHTNYRRINSGNDAKTFYRNAAKLNSCEKRTSCEEKDKNTKITLKLTPWKLCKAHFSTPTKGNTNSWRENYFMIGRLQETEARNISPSSRTSPRHIKHSLDENLHIFHDANLTTFQPARP